MTFFAPGNRDSSQVNRRLYAFYEIIYTLIDFGAAIAFLIGSVMFFYETLQYTATWFFVIGSVLFAAKPTIRVVREFAFLAVGDIDDVANQRRD